MAQRDLGRRRVDARLAGEVADIAHLVVGHQGDDGASVASARGPPRSVQIGLVLGRRVSMDHEPNVIDMYAACCDIRCDESPSSSAMEGIHRPHARILREVAVELNRRHTLGIELLRNVLCAVLGPGEDHRPTRGCGKIHQDGQVRLRRHMQDVVRHLRDR